MNKLKGFTIIELMIIAAILGILSVVGLGVYSDYKNKDSFKYKIVCDDWESSLYGFVDFDEDMILFKDSEYSTNIISTRRIKEGETCKIIKVPYND